MRHQLFQITHSASNRLNCVFFLLRCRMQAGTTQMHSFNLSKRRDWFLLMSYFTTNSKSNSIYWCPHKNQQQESNKKNFENINGNNVRQLQSNCVVIQFNGIGSLWKGKACVESIEMIIWIFKFKLTAHQNVYDVVWLMHCIICKWSTTEHA